MKKKEFMMTRRQLLKAGLIGGAGLMMPLRFFPRKAFGEELMAGLSDPALQPKFKNLVPDALMPGFKYNPVGRGPGGVQNYRVGVGFNPDHETGLRVDGTGDLLKTPIFGYGQNGNYTWPGMTFEVQAGRPTQVQWANNLPVGPEHLLPVDTSLHWCFSLHGYDHRTIEDDGVPIVVHLHGGHTVDLFDGNPEQFFTPNWRVTGPRFRSRTFNYQNDRPAGNLWYHDHALGITRLNVYAGLAGFYFVRDANDTGLPDNPLGLPAGPYEKAYAIQDRMFKATGELFYPAYPGDPAYADFITEEGVTLGPPQFPDNPNSVTFPDPWDSGGGPTGLAEFFGDHMVVNGVIWPFENVEPRNYRLHLLNGTDSRFMGIRFRAVPAGETDFTSAGDPIDFTVIGSDQGLAEEATITNLLLSEPGSRYDIVFDFKGLQGKRVIMENIGGDAPFGGDLFDPIDLTEDEIEEAVEDGDLFENRQTDRIMAFDVAGNPDQEDDFDDSVIDFVSDVPAPTRIRKVALFEGKDEFGRLQPLLGTAEPAVSFNGKPINWPDEPVYSEVGLTGQMEGSIAWHSPTTENPALNTTEEWEIWNMTGDAHPVHLHLVHFEIINTERNNGDVTVVGRQEIKFDRNVDDDGFIPDGTDPYGDGVYLVTQPTVQHNSVAGDETTYGMGFRIVHPTYPADGYGPAVDQPEGYVENAPKDMVTALPGQITRIRATFDKPGRYVWHCHILSHEDHEMMRTLYVGPER